MILALGTALGAVPLVTMAHVPSPLRWQSVRADPVTYGSAAVS